MHLLREERGPVLEVVVTRMKLRTHARIVAASATVPNVQDLGQWIGKPQSGGGGLYASGSYQLTCER